MDGLQMSCHVIKLTECIPTLDWYSHMFTIHSNHVIIQYDWHIITYMLYNVGYMDTIIWILAH